MKSQMNVKGKSTKKGKAKKKLSINDASNEEFVFRNTEKVTE